MKIEMEITESFTREIGEQVADSIRTLLNEKRTAGEETIFTLEHLGKYIQVKKQ